MRARTKKKQFDDITKADINKIHKLMRQGVIMKNILKEMNISQKAINMLFEKNMFGKNNNKLN